MIDITGKYWKHKNINIIKRADFFSDKPTFDNIKQEIGKMLDNSKILKWWNMS